ncbi:ferritin-like domain-containing protein [Flavobacterium silvaticum]|uniref:Ferritin-like domain-containing protein n=1 Tax=Flavobacterium silvaticum TaxID=1852020 RepID=A0A972FYA7_9FLAO|nr:ferritin-like domain-containing protein [Flavobacterium silvaticum]NMH27066.1 ferritin-like domain-containing protein [Flavobacterium silvaticum]
MQQQVKKEGVSQAFTGRRNFLKLSGLTLAGTGLLLAGCSDDDDTTPTADNLPGVRNGKFDLGGGDFGVLTYAYALEQLEADFYTRVVGSAGFASFSEEARDILSDIHKHEVIHREFFKSTLNSLLPSANVLPALEFAYAGVNFDSESSVLATAAVLEDTGVAAYNGGGQYIADSAYLVIAGQIVSVEARHASAIRDLINPGSTDFANTADANGLDPAKNPSEIISAVSSLGLITTPFTATFLP